MSERVRLLLFVSLPVFLILGSLLALLPPVRERILRVKHQVSCRPRPEAVWDIAFHHGNPPCERYVLDSADIKYPNRAEQHQRVGREFRVPVEINSYGFRNKEYPLAKGPGVHRIVFLGDSFTFGFGVPMEKGFFSLLEEHLSARCGCRVEVWNVAAPSWATAIHYLISKFKLPEYDPDLVVVMFDDTDLAENVVYHKHGVFDGNDLVAIRAFGDFDEYVRRADNDERFDERIDLAALYLTKIGIQVEKLGVPTLFVFYPFMTAEASHERVHLAPILTRLRQAGLGYWSLYDQFTWEKRKQLYFPVDHHWNIAGHAYVATLLEDYLYEHYPEAIGCHAPAADSPAPVPKKE